MPVVKETSLKKVQHRIGGIRVRTLSYEDLYPGTLVEMSQKYNRLTYEVGADEETTIKNREAAILKHRVGVYRMVMISAMEKKVREGARRVMDALPNVENVSEDESDDDEDEQVKKKRRVEKAVNELDDEAVDLAIQDLERQLQEWKENS